MPSIMIVKHFSVLFWGLLFQIFNVHVEMSFSLWDISEMSDCLVLFVQHNGNVFIMFLLKVHIYQLY